jgi:polysaccharide export outer membrane protein
MRLTRFLAVSLLFALAAAGCAPRPFAFVANPPGIDNVIYGQGAAPMVAALPQTYAGRGFFTSASPALGFAASNVAPPPRYALPPRYVAPAALAAVTPPTTTYVAAPPANPVLAPRFAAPVAYVPTVDQGPYTLDSGDRLRVVVFGQDGLTNSYVVDASGHIDMPLIGSVMARGATTDQLAGRIGDKLRDGFIREPHVAVEVEAYRPFFILGEVTAPGQYPYVANMTVETAVAIAGGFGPRGVRDHVTISRNIGGQLFRFTAPTTYTVRPGDTIVVPERWF